MGNKKNKKDIEKMAPKRETLNAKEKNKVWILGVVSIILAAIAEFIFVNLESEISLARVITLTGIISFIGLHFVIGFKKLYTIIVENRFKISIIMIAISTAIGYFINQYEIKEWLLNTNTVLSLWWNIKFYGLLLVSYELFSIITDQSKGYSIVGTIVVALSGAVQWNFDKIDSLILGQLIIVVTDKLLKEEKKSRKFAYILVIMASIVGYVFTFEGYAISFGYIFASLLIWVFIKNKENLKDKKKIIMVLVTFAASIYCAIITKNAIPNHYNDEIKAEAKGLSILFSYLYNMLLPYNDLGVNALYGSFVSIFPLPMIFALYYMFKNDDNVEFLLPITMVTVLETVFCISGFPDVVNEITLFSNVSISRCVAAVNLANLYIVFYSLKHINKKIFSISSAMKISVAIMLIVGLIGYPTQFATRGYLNLFIIEECILSFLFLILDDENYKKTLLFFLCVFALIGGITVNPLILI